MMLLNYKGDYDEEILQIAGLLHGAIHYCEDGIREWLRNQGLDATRIDHIIAVAWECKRVDDMHMTFMTSV